MNIGAPLLELETAEAWVLHHQRKLHRWAITDKQKRFRDLWNLVCDPATLQMAWLRVRSNKGARTAGIDGRTRSYVERYYGVERFLTELREQLRDGSFCPLPVRERGIPKRSGKIRYLGIPTLRDRVVQMALKLVLEPIFEADFYAHSYGYRPNRRALDAISEIKHLGNPTISYEWVIEADVEDCFGSIDHRALMSEVERRIGDRRVLTLLRLFLRAGVIKEMGELQKTLSGTPQGGIISPLLANVALTVVDREFVRRWEALGTPVQRQLRVKKGRAASYRLVRYADDFVIMLKGTREQAEELLAELPEIVGRIGLRLSPEKTRLTHIDQGFDFLGFRIVRYPRGNTKKPCIYIFVSDEAFASIKRKIKALTKSNTVNLPLEQLIRRLNPVIRGWAYYFRFASAKRTFRVVGYYTWLRIVHRWLPKKHPRTTWKSRQRYYPGGLPQERGVVLFQPVKLRVIRYSYRGANISTPWSEVEERPGHRAMSFHETEFLGQLEESLVGA